MGTEVYRSPFYEWLDHAGIRAVLQRALALTPGERIVLIKALIPGLVEEMERHALLEFIDELRAKATRYEDARANPGTGHASRRVPGERLGGPTPWGHAHLPGHRDADRPGGRTVERRMEAERWQTLNTHPPAAE